MLTVEENVLTLEGRKAEKHDGHFLHRGISARSFKRQFTLADEAIGRTYLAGINLASWTSLRLR
jgi:HSP20 family molecular chaperone IbpA